MGLTIILFAFVWPVVQGELSVSSVSSALLRDPALLSGLLFILFCGLVGLADDALDLPALLKTALLAAASVVAAFQMPITEFHFWGADGVQLPHLVGVAGTALWLFVFVNAANFMDGVNGLAMGCLGVMAALLGFFVLMSDVLGWNEALKSVGHAGLIAAFACLGFLAWNMTGRIFAGDAGSLGMGAIVAVLGVVVAERVSVWIPAILSLPFLADVLLTLIWRAKRGRKLTEGHREHAYQLLHRSGWQHWQVSALWWFGTLICAVTAWFATRMELADWPNRSPLYPVAAFAALALLFAMLWSWQRQRFNWPDQP